MHARTTTRMDPGKENEKYIHVKLSTTPIENILKGKEVKKRSKNDKQKKKECEARAWSGVRKRKQTAK